MVFYLTSANIKILRNMMIDFDCADETTPLEYMKSYIQNCPDNIEDAKIAWIVDTFLGIEKHLLFLKEIANHLSDELTYEEQDYCVIIFYAITFQIPPRDMQLLYKSIFNVSKTLLNTFTGFLSNNEVLTFISQVAQNHYDANYITEKIIGPLFAWQPYISEMAHSYAEYVKKVESRKVKPPTIPVQPAMMSRKGKEPSKTNSQPSIPATTSTSVFVKSKGKMLTKSVIDRRLKSIHEKNKQKAEQLLNVVKNNDYHFAQALPERDPKKSCDAKEESVNIVAVQKPKKNSTKSSLPPVRENIATIKRMNQRVQMTEKQEIEWLQSLVACCRNTGRIDELIENDRKEREKDRIYDIEKKHLMGQISHEEAVLAKQKLIDQNRKKHDEFLMEKNQWNRDIEKWKQYQLAKSRTKIEKFTLLEISIMEAKQAVLSKNKDAADKIRQENEARIAEALKAKQEELDRKIKMIKEIKVLAMIAKKAKVPKIIDLTETSGLGLLCEMSIAELQERVVAMKIDIKEELERKKASIKDMNETARRELEDVKESIKAFIDERADMRKQAKQNKKPTVTLEGELSKEINDLKKVLEEKRNMRMRNNSNNF